jgi:hypothetical protein
LKPPIFSARPAGDIAQQYLHRARMFRSAAAELPDYRNAEPFWPKYALLTHAIELSLKAFARHSIQNGKVAPLKEPAQHDLEGWYRVAVEYGLSDEPGIKGNIAVLNELHRTHYTRYPQDRSAPIPNASVIADGTVDHLISTFTQSINPR